MLESDQSAEMAQTYLKTEYDEMDTNLDKENSSLKAEVGKDRPIVAIDAGPLGHRRLIA